MSRNLSRIVSQKLASEPGQQSQANNGPESENDAFDNFEDNISDTDLSMDMEWDFEDSFDSDINSDFDDFDSHSSTREDSDNLADRKAAFVLKLAEWCILSAIPRDAMDILLGLLREIDIPVPKSTKTLIKTPAHAVQPRVMEPGEFIYFGIEEMLIKTEHHSLRDADTITLKICSDGSPLYKSSKSQLIPINGELVGLREIPIFPIGIYHGLQKPYSVDEYFEDFLHEAVRLMRDGVMVTNDKIRKPFNILNFCGDAPQRAWMRGARGHTCKHGCHMCDQVAKKINGKLAFSTTRGSTRTDETFTLRTSPDHHQPEFVHIPTAVEEAGFGMVTQFPLCGMHLLDLGVTKKILKLILANIPNTIVNEMETKLHVIYHFIPRSEFARRPRSFTEVARWKATEYRLYCLYMAIVILKDSVSEDVYSHYLHLVCAYRLISTSNAQLNAETANILLERFVENYAVIYGEEFVSYNVHNLLHICECVLRYGDVNEFSAYRNENYLQLLKKLVRKPTLILQQITNRIEEIRNLNIRATDTGLFSRTKSLFPACPTAYNGYRFDKYILRGNLSDAYCQISPDIKFQVSQFGIIDGQEVVIGKRFLRVKPFFDMPMDSQEVGIFMCNNLSLTPEIFPITRIQNKFIKLPYKDKSVLVAILHHVK